jgi:hypothetical protein
MTGFLIFAATVLLLVLALEPAHRRARRQGPQVGLTRLGDRDWARVATDLSQRSPAVSTAHHGSVLMSHLHRRSGV